MTHEMKLTKEPFTKIASGEKIIESRLFDEKRKLLNIDDEIVFRDNEGQEKPVSTKIIALYRYATFASLFSDFPASYFGGESKEFLLNQIHQFYSEEQEKEFGVIGIKISNTK